MANRTIVHFELPTKNGEAAGKFYKDLFGWEYNTVTMPEPYTIFRTAYENLGGGFSDISDTNPAGGALVYIGSDDIEADLKKAESLGAKVTQPKLEIPGFGWFGVFQDPDGNQVALWTDPPKS